MLENFEEKKLSYEEALRDQEQMTSFQKAKAKKVEGF